MAISYDSLWKMMIKRKISAAELRKDTGIAPNTMTRLRKNEEVTLSILGKICETLDCDYGDIISYIPDINKKDILPANECRTININNRRFLGNKYKLLPFITEVIRENCYEINSIADIFSGTGSVASAFQDRQIITNDILYSNYITNLAWFGSMPYEKRKLQNIISDYNSTYVDEENYMTENFSDTYFSRNDCSKIGYIRKDIEQRYNNGEINQRERAILISSLLYAMDRIANTCGHYDAYIQGAKFDKRLELGIPDANQFNNVHNQCYNEDANELVKKISADLVYIDPPYNSRQYCDSYHLLENIAKWDKPEVYGVAKKMDRSTLKSKYCTKEAEETFKELISSISSRYILLSYNNMGTKGDERSNAKISDEVILETLEKKGKVKVFTKNYKPFSAGKSDIKENAERLFLCACK